MAAFSTAQYPDSHITVRVMYEGLFYKTYLLILHWFDSNLKSTVFMKLLFTSSSFSEQTPFLIVILFLFSHLFFPGCFLRSILWQKHPYMHKMDSVLHHLKLPQWLSSSVKQGWRNTELLDNPFRMLPHHSFLLPHLLVVLFPCAHLFLLHLGRSNPLCNAV